MSLRSSGWPTATHASEENRSAQKVSTTALDFFLALSCLDRKEIRQGIWFRDGKRAGQGAFAYAEIYETRERELVAVKRSLKLHDSLWEFQEQELAQHFTEFCLELRILIHPSLRTHENIIDLRGILEEDRSGIPSLSLVLEYGDCGSLNHFLQQNPIEKEELVLDCVFQLASGFEALHNLGVCHGDVKTQNVLVVSNGDRWVYKICDFGHAVVSSKIGGESVPFPRGTAIYNAPELKDSSRQFSGYVEGRLEFVIQGTLQYPSKDRIAMAAIKRASNPGEGNTPLPSSIADSRLYSSRASTSQVVQDEERPIDTGDDNVICWAGELSLFQLYNIYECHFNLNKITSPTLRQGIRERMMIELKNIVSNSTIPHVIRASAALSVSQCLTIGFDSVYSTDDIIAWTGKAMILRSPFAMLWFPRLCDALRPDPARLPQISLMEMIDPGIGKPNQYYLSSSIRRNRFNGWRTTKKHEPLGGITEETICESCSSEEENNILRSALNGFDLDFIEFEDTPQRPPEVSSKLGFTPVHCACLGGHLSLLQRLLSMGHSASQPTIHGITPLHLCIFFDEIDMETAVRLLMGCGPCPKSMTSWIYWPDYDLSLSGSPLTWAILTRNLNLVKILLSEYTQDRADDIRLALQHYRWEILDEMFQTSPPEENLWDIYFQFDFEQNPYGHWIAHGSDRFSSIDQTLEIVQRHNLTAIEDSRLVGDNLLIMIERATTEEHFHHIEGLLKLMTASQIKHAGPIPHCILLSAIMRAKKSHVWIQTFKIILGNYSVEELQSIRAAQLPGQPEGDPLLHFAVIADSVVGARAILEKGVDPNQRRGSAGLTPLHMCLGMRGSVEMCDTLLKFNADLNAAMLNFISSPVNVLTAGGRMGNTNLIDHIMKIDHPEGTVLKILFDLIHPQPTPEKQRQKLLSYLLAIPNVAKHLNSKFPEGFTLLQYSAANCLVEITQLLLEAGADPLVGCRFGDRDVYTLQIVCARALFFGDNFSRPHGPHNQLERTKNQEKLFKIGRSLLQRQSAAKDNPFQGITELHLAAYMRIEAEVQRLLAEGMDPKANGKWPHLPKGITPRCLINTHLSYIKGKQIAREPNHYKKFWKRQMCMFDGNYTSLATIGTLELFSQEMKAARLATKARTKTSKLSRLERGSDENADRRSVLPEARRRVCVKAEVEVEHGGIIYVFDIHYEPINASTDRFLFWKEGDQEQQMFMDCSIRLVVKEEDEEKFEEMRRTSGTSVVITRRPYAPSPFYDY